MPIAPPAIDSCTTRLVPINASTIRTSAKIRSIHGARLKNSHHKRMINPPMTPESSATNMAWGKIAGTTNHPSHCKTTAIRPGHTRIGLRGVAIAVSVVIFVSILREHNDLKAWADRSRNAYADCTSEILNSFTKFLKYSGSHVPPPVAHGLVGAGM